MADLRVAAPQVACEPRAAYIAAVSRPRESFMFAESRAMGGLLIAVALVAGGLAGLIAWSGPVDPPGLRSRHARPTPTSGGLAIIVATCLGLALVGRLGLAAADPRVGWLAGLAAIGGLVGAADDLFDVPPRTKLLLQIALALLFARMVSRVELLPLAPGLTLPLGMIAGVAGSALWLVVLTNAVNFVDGADGLAPGAVIVGLFGLAVAAILNGQGLTAGAALIGAAAGLGFLPWNLPGHRLFQGDAGAVFSGFFLAGLALVATNPVRGQALSPYLIPFAALPMLTDVLLTLLTRARARKPLLSAHREHLYQLWLDHSGATHAALSVRYWLVMAAFTAAAVLNEQAPIGWRPIGFAAAVVVAIIGWIGLRRALRA
jgi:UDP-N-acetylmuramyl pentapeptide phosphotransferase/UDP-N-acetylglucosamine-1-phosphate transferase